MKLKDISLVGAGTTLEIYDSYIVGFMLGTLNQLFFPASLHGSLTSIFTFSILFLIRPISAFFWGILGDRYGKFLVFKHAILFMAIATFAIGLLPTYHQMGMVAPILLLSLRTLQGISISGEFGSAVVLCYEQSPAEQRFAQNGILYVFIFGGILIANAMTEFINHSGIQMNMAWRIPFLFGGICGLIIYIIRRRLTITETKHPEITFKRVLKNYKTLLIVACTIFLINLNWLYFSSISSILGPYLRAENINRLSIKCCIMVLIVAFVFSKYFAYRLRHQLLKILIVSVSTMYFIAFVLLHAPAFSSIQALLLFYYLEAAMAGIIFVSLPILIIDRLPTALHNSLYNVSNSISTAIIVGLMPFMISTLSQNHPQHWTIDLLAINLVISLLSLLSLRFIPKLKPDHGNGK